MFELVGPEEILIYRQRVFPLIKNPALELAFRHSLCPWVNVCFSPSLGDGKQSYFFESPGNILDLLNEDSPPAISLRTLDPSVRVGFYLRDGDDSKKETLFCQQRGIEHQCLTNIEEKMNQIAKRSSDSFPYSFSLSEHRLTLYIPPAIFHDGEHNSI